MDQYLTALQQVCEQLGVDPATALKGALATAAAAVFWAMGKAGWKAGRVAARLALAGWRWARTPRPVSPECQAVLLALESPSARLEGDHEVTVPHLLRVVLHFDGSLLEAYVGNPNKPGGQKKAKELFARREQKLIARKACQVVARLKSVRDDRDRLEVLDKLTAAVDAGAISVGGVSISGGTGLIATCGTLSAAPPKAS